MTRYAIEANFDGLVGPTHNYAGLSFGNVASTSNASTHSDPKSAALQGLTKMKALHDMGFVQGVLPPHERPHVKTLRDVFGFTGSDGDVLASAWKTNPNLVLATSSASPMWTANAATVSPSGDTGDGKVHFTPANLCTMFHRSIEHSVTGRALAATFTDANHFTHHPALPGTDHMGDEGAANHTRFCGDYGARGVEFFVYGRHAFEAGKTRPGRYPARQTYEASSAIARHHGLSDDSVVYAQQNPDLIDAGVFHNDVISVGNGNVLFHYEDAFVDTPAVLDDIKRKMAGIADFTHIEVPKSAIPLSDVVKSYLFNSQLLRLPENGQMMLILPTEAKETISVRDYLYDLIGKGKTPIKQIKFFDLRQSMRNGGGPACLRLRVALTEAELAATNQHSLINDQRFTELTAWVEKHYRDRLSAEDFRDPLLLSEVRTALDELTQLLDLGPIYDFQRDG
ncbi:N-succinylarginine dihydrolase [Thalassospira alkalitolerans]|uniref:N-succinylarginine dihydrolase n=1 Tax=Thalassospira alkalitolerans TaxID=1293890 RepID=UPI003AA97FB3